MQRKGVLYTILFAGVICVVCSVAVSTAAVSLKPLQVKNQILDQRLNVLAAAHLREEGQRLSAAQVDEIFQTRVRPVVVDLETGEPTDMDPAAYNLDDTMLNPDTSRPAPPNPAQVQRMPRYGLVYEILGEDGDVDLVVLPVRGKGLWSTLYGFLAVGQDFNTVEGITFYQHGETPGLGGEIDNPMWKARWSGRRIYGDDGQVRLQVIKGSAGSPAEDPYRVDGISGATITGRGVSDMIGLWLSEFGYKNYLQKLREQRS